MYHYTGPKGKLQSQHPQRQGALAHSEDGQGEDTVNNLPYQHGHLIFGEEANLQ